MKAAKFHLMGSAALVAAVLIAFSPKAVSTDESGNPGGETPVSGGGSNCLDIKVVVEGGLTPVYTTCGMPGLLGTTWKWKCLVSELYEPTLHGCELGYSYRECVENTVYATGRAGGGCWAVAIPIIDQCHDPDPLGQPGIPRSTATGAGSCRPGTSN